MHGIWRGGVFFLFFLVNIRADVLNLATRGRQSPTKQLRREALQMTTVLIWSSPTTGGEREQNNKTCTCWIIHVFTLHSNFALVLYVSMLTQFLN